VPSSCPCLKRILKLDRLRLRGPNGARDEFLLAATAQNLWRFIDGRLNGAWCIAARAIACRLAPDSHCATAGMVANRVGEGSVAEIVESIIRLVA
jgi:hypothetical protein